jgi:ABC-type branched-subunit amino acid transport system ATPase component
MRAGDRWSAQERDEARDLVAAALRAEGEEDARGLALILALAVAPALLVALQLLLRGDLVGTPAVGFGALLSGAAAGAAATTVVRRHRLILVLGAAPLAASAAALLGLGRPGGALIGGVAVGVLAAQAGPLLWDLAGGARRFEAYAWFSGVTVTLAAVATALGLLGEVGADIPRERGIAAGAVVLAAGALAAARRLGDLLPGAGDLRRARLAIGGEPGGEAGDGAPAEGRRTFGTVLRAVRRLPAFPTLAVTTSALAATTVALAVQWTGLAASRWGIDHDHRGATIVLAVTGGAAALATALWGISRHRDTTVGAARVLARGALSATLLLAATALVSSAWQGAAVGLTVGTGALVILWALVGLLALATTPPTGRVELAGTLAALGAVVGLVALGIVLAVERRLGSPVALLLGVLPTAVAGFRLRGLPFDAPAAVDFAADELVEREELARQRAAGVQPSLLACRSIDFSYGTVQVLFGVDFTLEEGEMVGLLGTNGAGKSTLLRVISGLGIPSSGSVRLAGEDITLLDPQSRVTAGVSQISGGKAVFGPMTVVENLRVYGHTLGRGRAEVERGIELGFSTFPVLADRRNQLAATLSGGEQQMLALTKALLLRPRILLIDELSLGLAPKIVGQLLELVREINQQGTAVVLVEQSVNVALSLVRHAYYMEKGTVRFDGPAAELLERPDLLRSVYLQGAAQGLGGADPAAGREAVTA